ncbi:alpha/beta hydrolase [Terrimonas pollutisoli]|uniref:alpha/beta hydrolase n=1 Tax=Terrimonas pollutisoli TaxID=3034147 RepID=UPI0023EE1FEA|nr:alpha/beta fold hydrolase [Terrimonas sp. H1YJ31]
MSLQRKKIRTLKRWLLIILAVYIAAGIGLYFLQERILFHPEKLHRDYPYNFGVPFKEINLPVNKEKSLNIIQFKTRDSLCKRVVLYFHGNRKNIARYAPYAGNFTKHTYEVWMIDYPGFGKTTGRRTEEVMYEDAAILYQMARARFAKDSIIIYGKSIGTGVAAQLASVKDCKKLILETPYYSIDALASHYAFIYPVSWMLRYHFPNYEYLKKVESPVILFHGTDDEVIPYAQSEKLVNKNPAIKLVTIEGGKHNNLNNSPVFQRELDKLLQ